MLPMQTSSFMSALSIIGCAWRAYQTQPHSNISSGPCSSSSVINKAQIASKVQRVSDTREATGATPCARVSGHPKVSKTAWLQSELVCCCRRHTPCETSDEYCQEVMQHKTPTAPKSVSKKGVFVVGIRKIQQTTFTTIP